MIRLEMAALPNSPFLTDRVEFICVLMRQNAHDIDTLVQ